MVREAEENADSDKKAKELIEARNQAEGTTHSIKKDYDTYKDQLTEEDKTKFEDAAKAVDDACTGEDAEAIQKSVQSFFEAAGPVMTKKQEAESAKATADAQPAKAAEPTTVDASFTEVDKEEKK
jgi:molecular chaperone DnaK